MTAKNEAEADLGKQFSGKKVHMYSSISPSVLGMQCLMPIREINLMHNCKLEGSAFMAFGPART